MHVSSSRPLPALGTTFRAVERLVAAGPFAVLVALAAAQGGYFPAAWRWSALALFALLAVAALLGAYPRLGRLELGTLVAMAALAGWIALSPVWSVDPHASRLELQRALVYVGGLWLALVVAAPRRAERVVHGLLLALALVVAGSLAQWTLAGGGTLEVPGQGILLVGPLGYANALGILAALAALLALGVAAHAAAGRACAAAAAVVPVCHAVVLLAASRGAWIALAGGLLFALALERSRGRLLVAVLATTPASLVALAAVERWSLFSGTAAARVELVLVLAGAGGLAACCALASSGLRLRRRGSRAVIAALLGAAALAALGGVLVRPPSASLGTRGHYWRVALEQYRDHPLLGSGAGTFEGFWLESLPVPEGVRDAHSLYLETLAELGPMGLLLVLVALGLPLVAARSARHARFGPIAAGTYLAFLLHAGIDWDWEMPAVTLAGLLAGAALLASRPRPGHPFEGSSTSRHRERCR